MNWASMDNSIKEPRIREQTLSNQIFEFEISYSIKLFHKEMPKSPSFLEVLESRKSERCFQPLAFGELGELFYYSCRTKQSETNEAGLLIEKRNTPSPGALHPILCLVTQLSSSEWFVYNSKTHSFDCPTFKEPEIELFKQQCFEMIPNSGNAYLIWYVYDYEKLSAKYKNPDSLALRESGVLSATQGIIAQALGFSFCILGIMGRDVASKLSNERSLIGVGAVLVGGASI